MQLAVFVLETPAEDLSIDYAPFKVQFPTQTQ